MTMMNMILKKMGNLEEKISHQSTIMHELKYEYQSHAHTERSHEEEKKEEIKQPRRRTVAHSKTSFHKQAYLDKIIKKPRRSSRYDSPETDKNQEKAASSFQQLTSKPKKINNFTKQPELFTINARSHSESPRKDQDEDSLVEIDY